MTTPSNPNYTPGPYVNGGNLSSVYNSYISSVSSYEQQVVQAIHSLNFFIEKLQIEVNELKKQVAETNELLIQHQVNRIEDELKGSKERA